MTPDKTFPHIYPDGWWECGRFCGGNYGKDLHLHPPEILVEEGCPERRAVGRPRKDEP